MTPRLSVVIPVLDSHEVVRRQLLHWQRMNLPGSIEFILVDDGSDPPITDTVGLRNLTIIQTHDTRPWTCGLARNAGARVARGEYLLMVDIDYILMPPLLEFCLAFTGDKVQFIRHFGVLDEQGQFTQDVDVLMAYGLPASRIAKRGLKMVPQVNCFCIRRDLFWELGGYDEKLIGPDYSPHEDRNFRWKFEKLVRAGTASVSTHRPLLYMFPNGIHCGEADHNPFNLFHHLTRKVEGARG